MLSMAVVGGILLNVGAFLTMKGRIYESVIVYLLADVSWMILAIQNKDVWGAFFIVTGTILAAIAFYKMQKGLMKKKL